MIQNKDKLKKKANHIERITQLLLRNKGNLIRS